MNTSTVKAPVGRIVKDSAVGSVSMEYYNSKGQEHNPDGPAVTWLEGPLAGRMHFYKNGVMHRDGDRPAIITEDGSLSWLIEGKYHRENGPAKIINQGNGAHSYHWMKNDKLHREDGPANIWDSAFPGRNMYEFCLKGKYYSIEKYYELCAHNIKMTEAEFFEMYNK